MHGFESALRAYVLEVPRTLLAKDRIERQSLYSAAKIDAWVADQVLPATFAFWNRMRFRREATWPQRSFGTDRTTREWQILGQMAAAICESARRTLAVAAAAARFGRFPTLADARDIAQRGCGELRAVESVVITGDRTPVCRQHEDAVTADADIAVASLQVKSARTRRPAELVAVDDYFGPRKASVVTIDGRPVTAGMFSAFLNPRILFAGNFVVQALLTRVQLDVDAITRLRHLAYGQLKRHHSPKLRVREMAAWDNLIAMQQRLENEWVRSPAAKCRDACIALVQVMIEWSRGTVETDWLGLPDKVLLANRGRLKYELTVGRNFRAAEQIARALENVQALYANAGPNESAIEEAISSGGLVFTGQRIYWDKQCLGEKLSPLLHRFVRRLAEKARHGQAVKDSDFEQAVGRGTMASRAQRLRLAIPPSLRKKLRPGTDIRTYKLEIASNEIYFFDD